MSRIGNKPITVPAGVEVKIEGKHITVKGPKGTLERDIVNEIDVSLNGDVINVKRNDDDPRIRSLHGLTRSLINNMVQVQLKNLKEN